LALPRQGFYINPSRRGPAVPGGPECQPRNRGRLEGEVHRRGWTGEAAALAGPARLALR